MDWGAALSAVATAVGIAKDLREIDKGLDQAEMKARLADVISNMADVKIALVEAQEEMRERDAEVARLQSAFQFKASLVERDGFMFEAFEDGSPRGEPFCRRCEQNHGRYYRMSMVVGGARKCPECKSEYLRAPSFVWDRR